MKTKCEGSCKEHKGEVKKVHVKSYTVKWGSFYYCDEAIEEDKRRGFSVIEDDHTADTKKLMQDYKDGDIL